MVSDRPTVALCMIVRDEAAVIERCLASVQDLVDAWVVVDTGSEDGTPELVVAAMHDRPGQLHRRPWRDFGHNRTELMQLARGTADYLLLLDADMTLEVQRPDPFADLTADAYLLRHAGNLDYAVPRLVRGDRDWRYHGVTHEYLAGGQRYVTEPLDSLLVQHHADGASRRDKFVRDRRLLEAQLAATPKDARSVFYLAQTLRDLGERDAAISRYRERVAIGGWDEEVFYAHLQIGTLLIDGRWEEAVVELLAAHQRRPTRAEPLYELARGYRAHGDHVLARLFATRGLELPYPDDVLFVHRDVYRWGLRFERAIAAYWTGDPELGVRDNEELLRLELPDEIAGFVRHNLDWCRRAVSQKAHPGFGPAPAPPDSLPLLADRVPETRVDLLSIQTPEGWPGLNPSIASSDDGFRLVLRTVNYDLVDGHYRLRSGDGVIRTRNLLLDLDRRLRVTSTRELAMVPDGASTYPGRVVGCEDCRLFELGRHWYASATVRDRNPDLRCEMGLLDLALDGGERLTILSPPSPGIHEKNWMPFVRNEDLLFLYSCDPTIVLTASAPDGSMREISRRNAPEGARGLRGGTQGLEVDEGWLFVAHDVVVAAGGARRYRHRIVRLGRDLAIAGVSEPFSFTGAPVEFAAGLARRDTEAIVSFGIDDARAALARLPLVRLIDLTRSRWTG